MSKHLWDYAHPYYGADGYETKFETLDELIENANEYDADMNHIYRWDWNRQDPDDVVEGEEPEGDTLTLYVVLPRKELLISWTAPVTEADEDKVWEFLASERVAGALRKVWAPLIRLR